MTAAEQVKWCTRSDRSDSFPRNRHPASKAVTASGPTDCTVGVDLEYRLNAIDHAAAANVFSQPASIQGFGFSHGSNRLVHHRRDEESNGETPPDGSIHGFVREVSGVFVGNTATYTMVQ